MVTIGDNKYLVQDYSWLESLVDITVGIHCHVNDVCMHDWIENNHVTINSHERDPKYNMNMVMTIALPEGRYVLCVPAVCTHCKLEELLFYE